MIPRNIGRKIHRITQSVVRAKALNSDDVILRWTEISVPPGYLPDVETSPQPVATPRQETLVALIHYVDIHTSGFVRYSQVKHGDVILDFPGDAAIDGRSELRFEIGGKIYVQKDAGADLSESWDARCGGMAITRTVLVTLMQ